MFWKIQNSWCWASSWHMPLKIDYFSNWLFFIYQTVHSLSNFSRCWTAEKPTKEKWINTTALECSHKPKLATCTKQTELHLLLRIVQERYNFVAATSWAHRRRHAQNLLLLRRTAQCRRGFALRAASKLPLPVLQAAMFVWMMTSFRWTSLALLLLLFR